MLMSTIAADMHLCLLSVWLKLHSLYKLAEFFCLNECEWHNKNMATTQVNLQQDLQYMSNDF